MNKLIKLALKRRWLVAVAFLVISAFGLYSWSQLAIDAYPDIADVTVQVVTQVPGLAAEEIEQQISIPLERALNGIPSLSMMRSKNTFGLSIIVLVFDDGTEDYWALNHSCLLRIGDYISKVISSNPVRSFSSMLTNPFSILSFKIISNFCKSITYPYNFGFSS